MRTIVAAVLAAVALVVLPSAGFAVDQNPVIVSPQPTDSHYEGYTGPFVVDFSDAPPTETTYNYAVFRDPVDGPTKLVAGPYHYVWHGVGANPQLMVKALKADEHLRFKITDGAGHEAQLPFAVKPGPPPRCALVVPSRVRVAAPLVKVTGRLNSTCATLDTQTADWKVTHSGQVLDYYRFNANTTDTWSIFDADPMGSYAILPLSARSSAPADVPQNSPTVVVRRDSRLGLGGSRSGNDVTLRTTLSVYSASANAFRPRARTPVVLAYRSCASCSWKVLRTLTTNLHGQASYSFTATAARDYRVTSGGTSQVWAALPKYDRV